MELFKQFTQMLEDFIVSIVDKRMAERDPQPAVAIGLEKQVLQLLNQDSENPDTRTAVESAIIQIVKDNIPDDLVTEKFMEQYCEDFLELDQAEQAVFDALRDNHRETTDIIHDNLCSNRLREMIVGDDILEDAVFEQVLDTDRFFDLFIDNLKIAIERSNVFHTNFDTAIVHALDHHRVDLKGKIKAVLSQDDTLKDELRTLVKAHFADNGEFATRVCQIIRSKL